MMSQFMDAFRRLSELPVSTPAACQPPYSAATPQGDPSWLPLTPRGQANSKVSHPGGDCNDNFPCTIDHAKPPPGVSPPFARCVALPRPVCRPPAPRVSPPCAPCVGPCARCVWRMCTPPRSGHRAQSSAAAQVKATESPLTSGTSPSRLIWLPLSAAITWLPRSRPTAAAAPDNVAARTVRGSLW